MSLELVINIVGAIVFGIAILGMIYPYLIIQIIEKISDKIFGKPNS